MLLQYFFLAPAPGCALPWQKEEHQRALRAAGTKQSHRWLAHRASPACLRCPVVVIMLHKCLALFPFPSISPPFSCITPTWPLWSLAQRFLSYPALQSLLQVMSCIFQLGWWHKSLSPTPLSPSGHILPWIGEEDAQKAQPWQR